MEEKRYSYIYEITFPDGKVYVGKHTPKHKGEAYNWYMGSGNYVKSFLKEHSKDELTKKLLVEGEFTIDELNKLEVEYVSKYKQLPNCVNKARGGDGGDTSKFIDYKSEVYHKNLSDAMKKVIAEGRGHKWDKYDWMKGKHLSEEHKKKISEANKISAKESNKLHSRESREQGFTKCKETWKIKKEKITSERIKLLEENNYKELSKKQIMELLGFESIRSVNRFFQDNKIVY